MSDRKAKLSEEFKNDQNAFIRTYGFSSCKQVIPSITWEKFCDMKIEAYRSHWMERKQNPSKSAPKPPKLDTPEAIEKAKAKLARAKAQAEMLQAALLAIPPAPAQPAKAKK